MAEHPRSVDLPRPLAWWVATAIAVLILGLVTLSWLTEPSVDHVMLLFLAGGAVLVYLFGRGCRYILAGR